MVTEAAPVTEEAPSQVAPVESAQEEANGSLVIDETTAASDETVEGGDDTGDESADTGPGEPVARQKWLQTLVDEGEATSDQKRELGSLNQSIRAQEENRKQAEQARQTAAATLTSLKDNFVKAMAGKSLEGESVEDYLERKGVFETYIQNVLETANQHVNAEREVKFRQLLIEEYGDTPETKAWVSDLKTFDQVWEASIQAAFRRGQQENPDVKKLTERAEKAEADRDRYKKQLGDDVTARGKKVPPSNSGTGTGTSPITREQYAAATPSQRQRWLKEKPAEVNALLGKRD